MQCHIAATLVLGAISVASIICTARSISALCQQFANRYTYLIGNCNVVFHAYMNANGYVVYDVFLKGILIKTTKPRPCVELSSMLEDDFRSRLAYMLVKRHTRKVTFSPYKVVQNTILDASGTYLSCGSPYLVHADDSVLKR